MQSARSTTPASLRFEAHVDLDAALLRRRVVDQISHAPPASARLTFLTAPAGFGKTTALAQLACERRAAGSEVAWLNCDERDKDAHLFSENLLAALARCRLDLRSGPTRRLPLAERLAQFEGALLICIDEYEAASSEPVDELVEQIARAAPPGLSLVLASRETPNRGFTRLQLAGRARLVDADLLRFTKDEALALMGDSMPLAAAAQVAAYADGWPFALQLARLRALTQHDAGAPGWDMDPRAKIPRRQIFDFLADEVIAALPPPVIAFLGDVAVLDTVDAASANALRERDDSLGLIRQLARLKPIVTVDDSLQTARLHPLLREYLVDATALADPQRIAVLYLRAARHMAERGELYRAVAHAVSAGRLDTAADIIEQAGAIRLVPAEGALRLRLLLEQLPEVLVRRRPRLRLLHMTCQITDLNPAGAIPEFERVERQVRDADGPADEALALDLEIARCFVLVSQAERQIRFAPWPVLAQATKLARAHATEDPRLLSLTLPIEIFMLHRYGPIERCERRTREMEAIHAEGGYTYNSPWIWMYRARNAMARGELELAERNLRHSLHNDAVYINYRQDSVGQLAAVLLGRIAYLRGDIDLALAHLSPLAAERTVILLELLAGAHVDAAACEFALGNTAHAFEMLEEARHGADDDELPHLGLIAGATQIELLARAGEREAMAALARQIGLADFWQAAQEPFALPWLTVDALARARFAVLLDSGDAAAAGAVAEALRTLAQASGHRLSEVSANLMAARAAVLADPARTTHPELEQALAMGAACGVVQTFLDAGADTMTLLRSWLGSARTVELGPARAWAQRLLVAWDQQFRSRAQLASAGTLTPREIDVLCELAKERSTKLIARTLMLSPETVKHHLKGVFAKLGVKSREDAVAEARRRTLIP